MSALTKIAKSVGLAAVGAAIVGVAAPAYANTVPPVADSALLGSWVNTNSGTGSVKQIVIGALRAGNVTVDAFGACSPTLCEWGKVPAKIFGTNVSATTGATFQTTQRFLSGGVEWSRTTLMGTMSILPTGLPVLSLRELTVFEDGSGRHNLETTDTFVHGKAQQAVTSTGNSVSTYRPGAPPALNSGAFGNWKPTVPGGSLAGLTIGGSAANPVVAAYGQCSPTACTIGKVRSITLGPSIASSTGDTTLAVYKLSFKKEQIAITYGRNADGVEQLAVAEFSEFTDGSGRSNYTVNETLVRA